MIWQSPKNWYQTRPESSHCHGDPRYIRPHHNASLLPENGEPAYQISVGEDLLNVGTLHRCRKKLDPGCGCTHCDPGWAVTRVVTRLTVSIKFGGRNISIATLLFPRRLQLSLLETFTRFVLHFYRGFLKLFRSYFYLNDKIDHF